MPRNYYDFNLEGINTDLLVVAALLNRADSFLYSVMEQKTGDMIFFLSPVYKWLVDLFSNPFSLSFTFHLLDFVICAGNEALVLTAVSLIIQFRKQFISCETMEDVTNVFNTIPLMASKDAVLRSVEYVYEAYLMGNSYWPMHDSTVDVKFSCCAVNCIMRHNVRIASVKRLLLLKSRTAL